jgi:DNA polymerase III subunit gamma/tau
MNMAPESALNWQVKGHARQLSLLERAFATNRLAHAYVFSGPEGMGKRTIARRLANFMVCQLGTACGNCIECKTFSVGSNADYIEVPGAEAIKIEAVRDLSYKMALKPYGGKHKVLIIDDAHNLTTEAANALLKMLEEPKPQTMMVLVTSNPHRMLPTILSRAQKIGFGPLEAGTLTKSEDELQSERGARESFSRFSNSKTGDRLVLAAEIAEQEVPDVKRLLDKWLSYLQESLRQEPAPITVQKIKGVMRAQRLLDQNVNTKLLLSEMMVAST